MNIPIDVPRFLGEQQKDKSLARGRVQIALRRGELKRPKTCEMCGGEGRIEAHHKNYRLGLWVTWLCKSCHSQENAKLRDMWRYSWQMYEKDTGERVTY